MVLGREKPSDDLDSVRADLDMCVKVASEYLEDPKLTEVSPLHFSLLHSQNVGEKNQSQQTCPFAAAQN
jgi:hypothetical protein